MPFNQTPRVATAQKQQALECASVVALLSQSTPYGAVLERLCTCRCTSVQLHHAAVTMAQSAVAHACVQFWCQLSCHPACLLVGAVEAHFSIKDSSGLLCGGRQPLAPAPYLPSKWYQWTAASTSTPPDFAHELRSMLKLSWLIWRLPKHAQDA